VNAGVEWPSRSLTTLMGTPAFNSSVAWVWRGSCLSRIRLKHDYADSRVMPTFERFSRERLMIPTKMSA
jgi:hypothetical protein